VRYELKTPWRNGTTHVIFEPLDFIARLVALVPKPRVNLTRFHGIFAPNSKYRALVTPAKRGRGKTVKALNDQTPAEKRASMTWAKRYSTHHMDNAQEFNADSKVGVHIIADLNIAGLLAAIALAFMLAALGKLAAEMIGTPQFAIIITTVLTILVATFLPGVVRQLSGHNQAGNVMMYIFLASVGATADIWQLVALGPVLFIFAMIIISVHTIVLFGVGKVLRLDLAELAMASAVCIGGPSSAAALASAKGWKDLLIPGVLAGSFGYAIGSFIGNTVVEWMRL
jgi:uncharacterized membrane protein